MSDDLTEMLEGVVGPSGVARAASAEWLEALELLTLSGDGWPHVAWLSAGEVLTLAPDALAFCVWPGSTTRDNLQERGRAVLQVVAGNAVVRIRLVVEAMGPIAIRKRELAAFRGQVRDVVRDAVGYAQVGSGPRFRLHDPDPVLARWQAQLQELRRAATRLP